MIVTAPASVAPPRAMLTSEVDRLRTALLYLLVVLVPVASGWVVWSSSGGEGDFNRRVTVAPFDIPLAMLLALWVATAWREGRVRLRVPSTLIGRIAAELAVVAAIAFVAHPSPRGIELALRVLAAFAVVDTVRKLDATDFTRLLAIGLAVGAEQAVLAIAQAANGSALGISYLDGAGPLYRFGTSYAGRGGLGHPYHLAVLLLVAIACGVVGLAIGGHRHLWLAGLTVCGTGLGVTYSRASLLAIVPAMAVLLVAARRPGRRVLAAGVIAIALGFAAAALTLGDGWRARYEASTTSGQVTSGRLDLWRDAFRIAEQHPTVGVGPGRYVIALDNADRRGELLPPHNVVIQALAELGVAGAVLTALVGLLFLLRVGRAGLLAVVPVLLLLPYFLLDAYPYVFPTGIALTSVALGVTVTQMQGAER